MQNIYSVSSLTEILRDTLEKRLPFCWVRGEITNLSRPASGHLYFNLKDERAQLQCVWFNHKQRKADQEFDPLTGEIYENSQPPLADSLRNGMEILCAGGIGIYAMRGQYQLLVELAQPVGEGLLAQKFERLKRKLAEAGYFDSERKRPLPANPVRIALITSSGGAAIHDFLELAQKRGSGARIRLYPAQVQGADADTQIAAMIALANEQNWGQVIVLIRGGGSLEDLWTFNEERLAKAIYDSRLPILAGIGHEVDFTLSDMTADCRAATPSHAAQILWPLRTELWQSLDNLELALVRNIERKLEFCLGRLKQLNKTLELLSPLHRLANLQSSLNVLDKSLTKTIGDYIDRLASALLILSDKSKLTYQHIVTEDLTRLEKLDIAIKSLNPSLPLERGYVWLYNNNGIVTSVSDVHKGDRLNAMLADGSLNLTVNSVDKTKPPDLS